MQFHLWRKNISHNNVVLSLRNTSLFFRILKFIVNIKSYCSHEILTVLKGPASTSESRPWESVCFCSRRQRWEGLLSSLPAPPPSMRGASPWPQGPTSFHCQRILETGWNSVTRPQSAGTVPGLAPQVPHGRTLSSGKTMLWSLSQEVRSCMSEALPPTGQLSLVLEASVGKAS